MNPELIRRFSGVVASGDEAAARAFLVDHFAEFPEEVQERIAFAFLREGLEERKARALVRDIQEKALAALSELSRVREDVENERRIDEIKRDLDIRD